MIYNDKIRDQLYSYFVNRLKMYDYNKGWLKGDCPYCGKRDKFGVNLYLNRTNCFVCGSHSRPFIVVKEIEDLQTINEVFNLLAKGKQLVYKEPEVKQVILKKPSILLPKEYKPIKQGNSKVAKLARKYLINRGFDLNYLSLKGYGYCGTGEYAGYIIIPYYYEEKLVYFNSRAFLPNRVKYKNPSLEDSGVAKSMIIYNRDSLFIYDKVFLVEGAINADTIGDMGIATGGKKISKYQISDIIKSPVSKVVLLLDPDAFDESVKLVFDLIEHKDIKLVKLPDEKDVNDIGKYKTMVLTKRSKWLSYKDLMELNNERTNYSYR